MVSSTPDSTTESKALRQLLVRLFPRFADSLADSLLVSGDGSFTPHGICLEFSFFYTAGSIDVRSPEVAELFRFVESVVAVAPKELTPEDGTGLSNALFTCLLEGIACTEIGAASRALMGPVSRAHFNLWHTPPPYVS